MRVAGARGHTYITVVYAFGVVINKGGTTAKMNQPRQEYSYARLVGHVLPGARPGV